MEVTGVYNQIVGVKPVCHILVVTSYQVTMLTLLLGNSVCVCGGGEFHKERGIDPTQGSPQPEKEAVLRSAPVPHLPRT